MQKRSYLILFSVLTLLLGIIGASQVYAIVPSTGQVLTPILGVPTDGGVVELSDGDPGVGAYVNSTPNTWTLPYPVTITKLTLNQSNFGSTGPGDTNALSVSLYDKNGALVHTYTQSGNGVFTQNIVVGQVTKIVFRNVGGHPATNRFVYELSVDGFYDQEAPDLVTDLTQTHNDRRIDLAWTNPSNPDFKLNKIYKDGVLVGTVNDGRPAFTVSGLTPATTYLLEITAEDTSLNESTRIPITVTTGAQIPDTIGSDLIENLASVEGNIDLTDTGIRAVETLANIGTTGLTYILQQPSTIDKFSIATLIPSVTGPGDTNCVRAQLYKADNTFIDNVTLSCASSNGVLVDIPYTANDVSKIIFRNVGSNPVTTRSVATIKVSGSADTTPPAEVTGVTTIVTGNSVQLNYTPPTDPDFDHINMYKWDTNTSDWVLVSTP